MSYLRRLQETGGGTLILSLPKEWVKALKLGKGSEVRVEVLPNMELRVVPVGKSSIRESTISIKGFEHGDLSYLLRSLISAYLVGYEAIRVDLEGELIKFRSKVKEFVRSRFVGYEDLEESENYITFYLVAKGANLTLVEALRKMVQNSKLMLDDLMKYMDSGSRELLEGIEGRDEVVDKLHLYVLRQTVGALLGTIPLSDLGALTPAELIPFNIVAKSVERVADHAVLIAGRFLREFRRYPVEDSIKFLFKDVKDLYSSAARHFMKVEISELISDSRRVDELLTTEAKVRNELVGELGLLEKYLILDSIKRIIGYSADIVEAGIDRYYIIGFAERKLKGESRS